MALSDLTLPGMELYGGIDLKKNYKKYFSNSLGISIGIHVLLIILYLGLTWFSEEDTKKIPVLRLKSLTDLAPPPSTSETPEETPVNAAPPPAADVQRPNFGVPVPVPDAVAPTAVMPDLNNLPVQGVQGGEGNVSAVVSGNGTAHVEEKVVEEKNPDPEEFIATESDPQPIQNLQALVGYPEIARKAELQGTVLVRILVGKGGEIIEVRIDKSSGSKILDDAAKEGLEKLKGKVFTPATQSGQPVKVWIETPIKFKFR